MKRLSFILLCLFTISVQAQDSAQAFDGHKWEAPYSLPVPKDWGIERFLIPIGFAPSIPYKGVEDIRFTPGWAKTKSDEYWSYAFLWYLDGAVTMDAATIAGNLKAYYTGLIEVNGSKITKEKIIPVTTSFREVKKDKDDLRTFTGSVKMLDYMSQQPIVLNAKVHLRSCPGENKTFVFYELSPQPSSQGVWKSLGQLWVDFKCKR